MLNSRRFLKFTCHPAAILSCAAIWFLWGSASGAARLNAQEEPAESPVATGHGLMIDRKATSLLSASRTSIADGDFESALQDLRRAKTSHPQALVISEELSGTFVPLFRVVFHEFFRLPDSMRQREIERTSQLAERELQEALKSQQLGRIPGLILQAPGTTASLQAHLIMARLHVNHGNFFAAKNWLMPLTLEGVSGTHRDLAVRLLAEIADQVTVSRLHGLNHPPIPDENDSPTAADAEPSDRPFEAAADGLPTATASRTHLKPGWQVQPDVSPGLRRQMVIFRDVATSEKLNPETTWKLTSDHQTAFCRTLRGLAAVDLKTGDTRWQYPLLPGLDVVLSADRSGAAQFSKIDDMSIEGRFDLLDTTALANAFCRDNVLTRVTADDNLVFLVDAETPVQLSSSTFAGGFVRTSRQQVNRDARLVALEKHSGRRVWACGRSSLRELIGIDSDNCWFAGPPSVHQGNLYCVFEWNGEMRLGCLLAATGEPCWSVVLAFPEQEIARDAVRSLRAAAPVIHQGLVWCSTTTGWTVCVDPLAKTLLWVGATHGKQVPQDQVQLRRRRTPVGTPRLPSSLTWTDPRLMLLGDKLIELPHETHEIVVFDALTGERLRQFDVMPTAVLAHADASRMILAEPASSATRVSDGRMSGAQLRGTRLRCIDLSSGGMVWSQQLDRAVDGFPTGRGVMVDGRLILPMSTGKLAEVDYETGRVSMGDEVVLPVAGWGHLVRADSGTSDLLYSAPDVLIRLSESPTSGQSDRPEKLASSLIARERWEEALKVLEETAASSGATHELQGMKFLCLEHLTVTDPVRFLPLLQSMAESTQQQAKVRLLEAAWKLKTQDSQVAATALIELLKQSSVELDGFVPAAVLDSTTLTQTSASDAVPLMRPRRSVLAWAAAELTRVLKAANDPGQIVDQLRDVSPEVMLHIHDRSVLPLLRQFLESAELSEQSFHVFWHSVALSAQADEESGWSAELQVLRRWLKENAQLNKGLRSAPLTELLLNVQALELPSQTMVDLQMNSDQDSGFRSRTELDERYRQAVQTQFELWNATEYDSVPVSRTTGSFPQSHKLQPAVVDDAFLREFRWTVSRGDFGRIYADGVATFADSQWSIPATLQMMGSYSNQTDILRRAGTVLLLNTTGTTAAVSVIDGRLLWSRSITGRATSFQPAVEENFQNFDPGRDKRPSEQTISLAAVIGAGQRWVCVRLGPKVECLDSLTGAVLWAIELPAAFDHVVANHDLVIASAATSELPICLDRRTGQRRPLDGGHQLARRAILGAGNHLVCWSSGAQPEESVALEWVDPKTSAVEKTVPLTSMDAFYFLDDETLAGFGQTSGFVVVNLVTGQSDAVSWPDGVSTDVDPLRWQIKSDGLNYYLAPRVSKNEAFVVRAGMGRQMLPFSEPLIAVDREKRQVRWIMNREGVFLASTDQPELPVLLYIESQPLKVAGQLNPLITSNTFRGIGKLSGNRLFSQVVPSRYGLRYTSTSSKSPNTIDINVYGMNVRLEGRVPSGDLAP